MEYKTSPNEMSSYLKAKIIATLPHKKTRKLEVEKLIPGKTSTWQFEKLLNHISDKGEGEELLPAFPLQLL